MRLRPLGDAEAEALDELDTVFVTGYGPTRLRRVRWVAGAPVLYLEGVRDREAARRLTHAQVFGDEAAVARARTAHPEEDRAAALAGAPVWVDGAEVGRVRVVERGGPIDLARVRTATGEALVPLGAPYVRVTPAGLELVDPPEGLLDPA